jgi:hypothetical protein
VRIAILVMLLAVIATNLLTFAVVFNFGRENNPVCRIPAPRETVLREVTPGVLSCRRLAAGKLACGFPAGFRPE